MDMFQLFWKAIKDERNILWVPVLKDFLTEFSDEQKKNKGFLIPCGLAVCPFVRLYLTIQQKCYYSI